MPRTLIYFNTYIILDFLITYRNASVLCQSECACLHQTVNTVVFFVKSDENTYPKGRALIQMYRVVAITKRGNCVSSLFKQVYLIHLHRPVRFNGYPCPTSIHLWVSDDFLHEFQQQQPVVISHTLRGVENKHQVYHSTATFCATRTQC